MFDPFLKFLLHDCIDKLPSFDEEKVVEVVDGPSVGGTIHDFLTIVEHGIEFLAKKFTNSGRGGWETHKNLRVKKLHEKSPRFTIVQFPRNIYTPVERWRILAGNSCSLARDSCNGHKSSCTNSCSVELQDVALSNGKKKTKSRNSLNYSPLQCGAVQCNSHQNYYQCRKEDLNLHPELSGL